MSETIILSNVSILVDIGFFAGIYNTTLYWLIDKVASVFFGYGTHNNNVKIELTDLKSSPLVAVPRRRRPRGRIRSAQPAAAADRVVPQNSAALSDSPSPTSASGNDCQSDLRNSCLSRQPVWGTCRCRLLVRRREIVGARRKAVLISDSTLFSKLGSVVVLVR